MCLDGVLSFKYMHCLEIERTAAEAFHGYGPWIEYLESPASFRQHRTYRMILDRIRDTEVYAPFIDAFGSCGISIEPF